MTSADIAPARTKPVWTSRQKEVLDLLACGYSNAEIAERLDISLQGAKWHVSEVISILGVTNREEAADYWRRERSLHRRLARALGLLAVPAKALAIGAGVLVAGIAVVLFCVAVLSDDDSTPGAVADGTETPSATATPAVGPTPTQPGSTLAVYTTRSFAGEFSREVVVHDLMSGTQARWGYSEGGTIPIAATLAGSFVFTATNEEVVRWNLDGSGRLPVYDEWPSAIDISASPDGTILAATAGWGGTSPEYGRVIFFDVASGSEVGRVDNWTDPWFPRGPINLHWRADGAGVLVTLERSGENPDGRMTVWLDGTFEVHEEADGGWLDGLPSPGATLLAGGPGSARGCYGNFPVLEVYDLEAGQLGAQLAMGELGLVPRRWHPDETHLLVQAIDPSNDPNWCEEVPEDGSTEVGLFEMDTLTGAATPVTDELALMRAWYGTVRLEVTCNDGSILVASADEHEHFSCTGPPDQFAHMDALTIDDIVFGSGFDVEYLGMAGPPLPAIN